MNKNRCRTQKANSTLRASRAVPHPSTDRAFRRLTSEFGWDRVYSTKYGRWRKHPIPRTHEAAEAPRRIRLSRWKTLSCHRSHFGSKVLKEAMRSRSLLFWRVRLLWKTKPGGRRTQKANSTLRASRAVPHPSTDRAFRRLTSEFGWDRVYSTKYGRWRKHQIPSTHESKRQHNFAAKTQNRGWHKFDLEELLARGPIKIRVAAE